MTTKHPQVFDCPLALAPGGQCVQAIRRAGSIFSFSSSFGVTVRSDGIAIVKVIGGLHRGLFGDDYADLRAAVDAAVADARVRAVVLDVDSPGGAISGLFDLTSHLYALRGAGKPLWAIANDLAASAAYAIASAAEQVWATQTALVGSIGVIALHADQTAWNEREGFKITEVVSGARKAELSPHRPLTEDALRLLQSVVDDAAALFISAVAQHRGLYVEAIRAQHAALFRPADAVAAGLVDRVGSRDEMLAELSGSLTARAETVAAEARRAAAEQEWTRGFASAWAAAEPVGLSASQVLDLAEAVGGFDAARERIERLGAGALISDATLAKWHGGPRRSPGSPGAAS